MIALLHAGFIGGLSDCPSLRMLTVPIAHDRKRIFNMLVWRGIHVWIDDLATGGDDIGV
jgi:hypothetical protein